MTQVHQGTEGLSMVGDADVLVFKINNGKLKRRNAKQTQNLGVNILRRQSSGGRFGESPFP